MKKRAFSLVELFILFSLLALVAGSTALMPFSFFRNAREQECKRMIRRNSELAAEAALLSQAGAILRFTTDKNTLLISIKGERPPSLLAKRLMEIQERLETAPSIELVTEQGRHLQPPFAIIYYPNGESFEEKSSERVKEIQITSHTSNGDPLTITTNVPASLYEAKAPTSEQLYPKIETTVPTR